MTTPEALPGSLGGHTKYMDEDTLRWKVECGTAES